MQELLISQSHWSLLLLGNKPKKFNFVHQTVSHWEACAGWAQDPPFPQYTLVSKLLSSCKSPPELDMSNSQWNIENHSASSLVSRLLLPCREEPGYAQG